MGTLTQGSKSGVCPQTPVANWPSSFRTSEVPELQLVELEPFLAKDAWAQKLRARCAGE